MAKIYTSQPSNNIHEQEILPNFGLRFAGNFHHNLGIRYNFQKDQESN